MEFGRSSDQQEIDSRLTADIKKSMVLSPSLPSWSEDSTPWDTDSWLCIYWKTLVY